MSDYERPDTLSLEEKIEAIKKLAPGPKTNLIAAYTGSKKERRMERILLSVAPEDLPWFKYKLDYDGDYKDLVEYVLHDIDDKDIQNRIVEHFRKLGQPVGVKVLTDVDDTMYANLVDSRYPKRPKKLYPGVLEFYDALKHEPFDVEERIPVTTLSARPDPVAGKAEEASLRGLVALSGGKLSPSGLSGEAISSAVGTAETFLRKLDLLSDVVPHGQEDKIAKMKFENFANYSRLYPEYRYIFVGDSGQADALTAQMMITETSTEGTSRVVTTFIHDLGETSRSPAFEKLRSDLRIEKASDSGRGVIVFRNYIHAATIAFGHSSTLGNLISAEGLARVTKAAVTQFQTIDFDNRESESKLREQYRQDAEGACGLLEERGADVEQELKEIHRRLADGFQGTTAQFSGRRRKES